jgi:hypothetical protein
MKRFSLLTLAAAFLMLMHSCESGDKTASAKPEPTLQPNDSIFHVNDGGYNFSIVLPKDLMIMDSPKISVNGATGELHIQVGDQFWIVASQEQTSMQTIKSAMQEDMLFTSRIVEETGNGVLYQRILPDGSEYDYSYRNFCEVGGKPYVFKTCEEGEFSMESVSRMKQAIASVRESL